MTPPISSTLVRDAALIDRVAATISVPSAAPANSFVLHAPLELMARVGLLPFVAPARRDDALGMIEWLGEQYEAAGESVVEPASMPVVDPVGGAASLLAAIADGDLDAVDSRAVAVLSTVGAHEAAGLLGEALVTSLAAAGHAPIGFSLLARVRGSQIPSVLPATLLRGALRSIASQPDWQVRWHQAVVAVGVGEGVGEGDAGGLYDAVKHTPRMGMVGNGYIFPTMSQVQDSGEAARLLGPVLADRFDVPSAARTLTRVAAWSMVHDDREHAPYGWTHALTMPQAVMALAGAGVQPRTALAVAGTFTVGFRASLAHADLPDAIVPGELPEPSVSELATAAALHEDAHLVKYTLACLHAAADDPQFRPLYLRAAAHLVSWWNA